MAKEKKENGVEVEAPKASADIQSPARIDAPQRTAEEVEPNALYRNISGTLLTLDDGAPFAKGTTVQLTDAEVARFEQAAKSTGQKFIRRVS